ncbi:hypothetical protein ACLOJK_013661 [Asimina triloba]
MNEVFPPRNPSRVQSRETYWSGVRCQRSLYTEDKAIAISNKMRCRYHARYIIVISSFQLCTLKTLQQTSISAISAKPKERSGTNLFCPILSSLAEQTTTRTPCIQFHLKLFLPSVLKDALAQCHVFTIGRRSTASSEEKNSGSEIDDDQVIILAIRRRAMEAKHRRKDSLSTENLCWVLSPAKGEAFIAAAAAAAAATKEKKDEECNEEYEDTDAFFSAKSCFSRCSSMSAGGFELWENFGRPTVWEEFCHLKGWPFGLSRKMMLLPPLPRSPSDSWTWCKPNQMAKMGCMEYGFFASKVTELDSGSGLDGVGYTTRAVYVCLHPESLAMGLFTLSSFAVYSFMVVGPSFQRVEACALETTNTYNLVVWGCIDCVDHDNLSNSIQPMAMIETNVGKAMASADEIAYDLPPLLRIYKDGRIERLMGTEVLPPSVDPTTGVSSKDVDIVPELGVSARLYLPKITDPTQKLPVLVYYHGGGFCIETPFSPSYHNYLNSLVSQANVVAVSVHYRRVPEHHLPVAFNDSWAALQWVASHAEGGAEPWLRDHADLTRLFLGGDSAGGNIAHDMAMRAATCEVGYGVKILGVILIHPFFWGTETIGNEGNNPAVKGLIDRIWKFACPSLESLDEAFINPTAATSPSLSKLGCRRVIVCVAEKDKLKDRGWLYYHTLASSGWEGTVEMLEAEDEEHVFHLTNPTCEGAVEMMTRLVDFLNFSPLG